MSYRTLACVVVLAIGCRKAPPAAAPRSAETGHVGDHSHSHKDDVEEPWAESQPSFAEQVAAVERGERDAIELDQAEAILDADLQRIQELKKLRSLRLLGAAITDAGIEKLAGLTALERVNFDSDQITDAGAATLARLKKLSQVRLASAAITDEGLASLAQLDELKYLILPHTRITDQGLKALARCRRLESLYIEGTPVTEAGVAGLLESHPDLHVHY